MSTPKLLEWNDSNKKSFDKGDHSDIGLLLWLDSQAMGWKGKLLQHGTATQKPADQEFRIHFETLKTA